MRSHLVSATIRRRFAAACLMAILLLPCVSSGQTTAPATAPATSPNETDMTDRGPRGDRNFDFGRMGRIRRGESPDSATTETQGRRPDSDAARSFKDEDGMVSVNLREAKIDQIVKFIADNTGKTVILQPGLEGTINIIAPKPLPIQEALDLVYESLLLHKIVVIETEKRLAIVNSEKAALIPLPIEPEGVKSANTLLMKILPLKDLAPDAAITLLAPLVENKDAIKSLPQANALTVKGTNNEIARIEAVLAEVDKPGTARLEIRLFPLKSATASTLATQLQSLLAVVFDDAPQRGQGRADGGEKKAEGGQPSQEASGRQRAASPQMRIIPDEANRRIIVAATPAMLSYIAELIEQLDQTNPDAFSVNQIEVANADPQSIANLVGQIYRELGGSDEERRSVRAIAQGRTLFIISAKERFAEVASLVKRLDSAEPVMELRVYRLQHAEAEQTTEIVQNILRSGAFSYGRSADSQPASAPASGPAVGLLGGASERTRMFEDRVRFMREQSEERSGERSRPEGGDMRGFIMERLMGGEGGGRQGRSSQPQPTVAADERMNALVVVAYPEQQDQLGQIIKEIDSPEPGDLAIRLVNVPSAKAEEIQRAVQSLFQSRGRARGSRDAIQISASPDGKKLIVLSKDDDFKRVKEIVDQLQGGENVKLHTVPVNFGDTALLSEMVMEVNASLGNTSSTVSVSPHLNGKSLLVMASDEDFALIKNLIAELDNKQSITLRVFELKNADADDLAVMIESAIEAGYATEAGASVRRPTDRQQSRRERREGGSSQDAGVQVYPDKRTNTLVVVGTPEDIDVVADLVTRMDREVPLDLSVRTINLVYTRASEVQGALQRVFQRLPRESDRDIVEITATKDDKQLIVLSSEENYRKITDLLKELDSREEAELTVIQLKYADASDLAGVLGNMLRSAKAGSTGRAGKSEVYTVYGESGGLFTTKSDVTIIAETRINALLVAASAEDLKVIQDLVQKLDRPREEQLDMHIVQLNYADATSVANAAGQFFQTDSRSPRDEVKILANTYDNSIMVFASDENWERIQKFIKDMDVADVGKRGTKTYELKYVDASRLATQLEELYSEQQPTSYWDYWYGSPTRRQTETKINFVASPIGNRLMVVAPPQEISKIDELVAVLDSPEALEGVRPRIYYIRHTDATQMRDILTDLFEGTDSSLSGPGATMYRPRAQMGTSRTPNTALGEVSFVVDRDANALIAFSSNPANLELVDDLINQLDILAPESTNTETVQLEYADAYNMAILLNSLYGGALPRQSGSQDRSTQQQQQQGYQNQEQSSVTLAPSRTLERKPEYSDLYFWWQSSNERQNEQARPISTLIEQVRIVPDLRTNSLLLTAAPHHLEPLKALIAYLDRPEPQVVIKTRIVEIIKRGEERTGVRWTPDPSTIRPEELDNAVSVLGSLNLIDSFGDTVDSAIDQGPSIRNSTISRNWADAGQHIIDADTNLTLLIQLLLKNSDSRELSKPTLTVDNNETGTIFVGSDVPFITESQVNTNGARNDSYDYREVGTRLDITPHINSKGQVVLEIDLGSSNIREGEQLFGGAILDRRTYSTQIALEDNQTLVLGGILGKSQRDVLRKAPILGDIPIICHAFRKTEKLDEDTELVAFVSPQVLWNRSDADNATNQIIRETNPENADFYPEVKPPTPAQQRDMIQLDQRREELTDARTEARTRAWEYNIQKLREGPDQLNRAYEIINLNEETPEPTEPLPPVVVPQTAPAEKTGVNENPNTGKTKLWQAEAQKEVPQSSETDVMRARLNELLDEAQKQKPPEPQAAALPTKSSGAVLEMIEVK